jgi:ubiquinone/menaquinone biosynthesis C-methylase UbiE
MAARDQWAAWLLERRFAAGEDLRREFMDDLAEVREKVLDNAALSEGETLLDVGCGDGLIGFGALDRGANLVVFSDVSEELLDTCRAIAAELDILERCRFVLGSAEGLAGVADSSVDVVTTRSVLIYVTEKERAFQRFHRVLRPGGRISLFEPINRLSNFFTAYDVAPVQGIADRVRAVYERIQPPDSDPMLNFDERDLVEFAERAGFEAIFLRLELEVGPPKPRPWETFVRMVGNPKIPSYGEAMEQALAPDEREQLAAHLRPLVEEGRGRMRKACAYLHARKADSAHG